MLLVIGDLDTIHTLYFWKLDEECVTVDRDCVALNMWRSIRTVFEAQGSEFHPAEEALGAFTDELDLDLDDSYTAKRADLCRLRLAWEWPVFQREGYDLHPGTVDLHADADGPVRPNPYLP